MRIGNCVLVLLMTAMLWDGTAAPFSLLVESGQALLKPKAAQAWTKVGNGTVGFGDSLLVPAPLTASIHLDSGTTLLLKDSCTVVLDGSDTLVQLELIRGQVFLRREEDGGMPFRIDAGSCTFIPVGTAAAVKIADNGEPRVAVLRGTVRMAAANGKTLDIPPGSFGSFDPSGGALSRQKLPPKAIRSLQEWSGVELEQTATPDGEQSAEVEPVAVADTTRQDVPDTAQEVAQEQDTAATQEQAAVDTDTAASQQQPPAQAETVSAPAESDEQESMAQPAVAVEQDMGQPVEEQAAPPAEQPEAEAQGEQEQQEEQPAENAAGTQSGAAAPGGAELAETSGDEKAPRDKDKPTYEIGAGTVTVGDEQWTRIAFAVDVPIWRFGVCFDLELFLDAKGQFSNKGWDFTKDNWAKSLARKIRYVRFNHPGDPVYFRFMGLDNVSFAYGFVVDRFSNMVNYPDEKLLGLQVEFNDITPIGVSVQAMVADFLDFRNDGGVVAGRFALKPLKPTEAPIIKGIDIGVTYATDRNQYAPARDWDLEPEGSKWDRDQDNRTDSTYLYDTYGQSGIYDRVVEIHKDNNDYDPVVQHKDEWARKAYDEYSILGFDIGVPLIATKILGLDVYGQMGMSMDGDEKTDTVDTEGWGVGAPGVALRAGPFWARVEYRRIQGMFEPGYFGPYYLEERIDRSGETVTVKESSLEDATLNGIYGSAGLNIADIFITSASFQRLGKGTDPELDQRFEATGALGGILLEKIPKLNKAEVYLYKTRIQRTVVGYERLRDGTVLWDRPVYDAWFFERTPNTYWGYRVGAEVMPGASIIWDTRYGWKLNDNGELVDNNSVTLSAGLTF